MTYIKKARNFKSGEVVDEFEAFFKRCQAGIRKIYRGHRPEFDAELDAIEAEIEKHWGRDMDQFKKHCIRFYRVFERMAATVEGEEPGANSGTDGTGI